MNIDPRGLTVIEWCDYTVDLLATLGVIPERLDDPDGWKEWAWNVSRDPNITPLSPPNPDLYENWEEWAMRFNQAVPLE